MTKCDLRVDWATHEAAKYACEHWHYSRCLPAGKLVKIGVWENAKFIGVVIFGRGASPFLGKKFHLPQNECAELVRVALTRHQAPVSKIVAIANRFLKQTNSGLRLIVSFADPHKGHIGTIYQAGNWIFAGVSPSTVELFINGRWIHWRGGFYSKTQSTPRRVMPGKYRYLMPLDNEMRKKILPLSRPYPKRAGSDTTDTPANPAGEGGSTPTPALHSQAA